MPGEGLTHGVSTRVLIISDTHAAPLLGREDETEQAFKEPLPAADVLIHCGTLEIQYLIDV